MRIFTPDGTELMTITSIEATAEGILIGGTIMGAMPMKGQILPGELQVGMKFLGPKLIWRGIKMLFGK
jgi:hypothetical protein